ncbi:alpha/beta hydrolase [Henriciella sp.]|uniref:alpha/beta hydrolase n=1 Tax=Henriciella sp. TaxID=1968823 RepID=UPI00262F6FBB|nr:alpha/beta hydrolase [Henriciella sp.]
MKASPLTHAGELDPEIRRFVEDITTRSAERVGDEQPSLQDRRAIAEEIRAPWREGGPVMAQTDDLTLPDTQLRLRIHVPQTGAGEGTLLYLHGGGWMLFSIDTHDRLMREYAERTGCAVVGLDYSLAPEHRFPRALEESVACLAWLNDHGAEHGLNTERIVIGGDSAGGNLALATALKVRDAGGKLPDGLLLNYAALDNTARGSYQRYDGPPYMLDISEMQDFWREYLGAETTEDPYARVLLNDLSGLPSVHLCIAECDILLDENMELHERLQASGIEVSSKIYSGATHSFLEAVSNSSCADRALSDAADWMRGVFGP